MSTTHALSTRLNSLADANKATVQLVTRLAKLQFQPGSTPLDSEEGDVRVELSSEIHESLKQQEEELELLKLEVEEITGVGAGGNTRKDSEKEWAKSRLSVQVIRLGEDLKHARSQFRKAQLSAKRNAEAAKKKERELLFAGIHDGHTTPTSARSRRTAQDKQLTQDDIVANASSDVTLALRRTHQLLQSELSRSHFVQETLDQSSAALADLGDKYTDLNSLLTSSKTLLSSLLRSQKSDTWYLETTFYILLTTIAWLVYRRFLYGPLWWLVWLPVKLLYKSFFLLLGAVGLTGGASLASTSAPGPTTSLVVQPSAVGRPPPRMEGQGAPYMRAGAGGGGAKQGMGDPSQEGSVSQQVGQMAEAAGQEQEQQQQEQQQQQQQQAAEDVPRRGDGTPLVQSDKPRNPKKRMWDEGVERAKAEEQQRRERELYEEQDRVRDEL